MRALGVHLDGLRHLACTALLLVCASALAQAPGGAGSHGSGGSHSSGSQGGSSSAHGGVAVPGGAHYSSAGAASIGRSARAASAGGPHSSPNHGRGHGGYGPYPGYGWYGGFPGNGWYGGFPSYGYFSGYPGYGYYGDYGWGALGYGAFVPALPAYYRSFWWGGVPYYYGDNSYYRWNDAVASFEAVPPPPDGPAEDAQSEAPVAPVAPAAPAAEPYAYPQRGQSPERLGKDRYECHRWAVSQSSFDPTRSAGGDDTAQTAARAGAYRRAAAACLAGRGYSVR